MSILNADIVWWAGLTKYVIYRKRGVISLICYFVFPLLMKKHNLL